MADLIAEMNHGGPFMWIILGMSIFSLGLILHKMWSLWIKYRFNSEQLTKGIIKQVEANNYARAIQYCNGKYHPVTTILKAGLMRANKSEREIRRAIEVAASNELPRFKKGVNALPHLSNMVTLVGLLATIRGLIIAFSGMEGGDAVKRQEALSTGIAIAFRATFFALSVAVILIAFFVWISSKQNDMLARMEHAAAAVVDALCDKNKRLASQRQPGA